MSFNVSFLIDKSDLTEDLVCPICLGIFNDPVGCPCPTGLHIFCKLCIGGWTSNSCPTCRSSFDYTLQVHSVKNMVSKLQRICGFKNCTWKGKHGDHVKHLLECEFKQTECKYCSVSFITKEFKNHQEKCEKFPLICEYCSWSVPRNSIDVHYTECPSYVIKCIMCNLDVIRQSMEVHITQQCVERSVICEYEGCIEQYKAKDEENHLNTAARKHLQLVEKELSELKQTADDIIIPMYNSYYVHDILLNDIKFQVIVSPSSDSITLMLPLNSVIKHVFITCTVILVYDGSELTAIVREYYEPGKGKRVAVANLSRI